MKRKNTFVASAELISPYSSIIVQSKGSFLFKNILCIEQHFHTNRIWNGRSLHMSENTKSTSNVFERLILSGMKNIDIHNHTERQSVYEAAFRALRNTHLNSKNLNVDASREQVAALEQSILKIEQQYSDALAAEDKIQSLTSSLQNDFGSEFDEVYGKPVSGLNNALQKIAGYFPNFKSGTLMRNSIIGVTGILCLVVLVVWSQSNTSEQKVDAITFPIIIDAEDLKTLPIALGANVKRSASNEADGILFDITPTSTGLDNRINFQLNRDLATQLLAMNNAFIVKVKLKKINDETLEFDMFAITGNHTSKSNFTVKDQNSNEYFVVSSSEKAVENNDIFVIILEIPGSSAETSGQTLILVENITLSKI